MQLVRNWTGPNNSFHLVNALRFVTLYLQSHLSLTMAHFTGEEIEVLKNKMILPWSYKCQKPLNSSGFPVKLCSFFGDIPLSLPAN